MVQPISPTMTAPLAYSGGISSKSAPGFGAQLSATLGQVQATASGLQALASAASSGAPDNMAATSHHHHHGLHHGQQSVGGSTSSLPWQPGGGTLSAAYAGISRTA
ncbi:hypothetical protein ACOSOMT5_P0739 [Acidiphilium sp. MT5]